MYAAANPLRYSDPRGLETYLINRDLAAFGESAASRWNPITHTFVVTTYPDGTIAHTYSWGNDANLRGWNLDQHLDIKTALEALKNGKAELVAHSYLDRFVDEAFYALSDKRNEHQNGLVYFNCKTEANNLLDLAETLHEREMALQQQQWTSTFLRYHHP